MLIEALLPAAGRRLLQIGTGETLLQAARLLDDGRDMLLACDGEGRLAGVVTKTDVVRQTGHCAGASCTAPLVEAMTREVVTARPEDLVQDVWKIVKSSGFKNIPVIDRNGRPMGVLNARDLLQALLQEVQDEENLLRDYVMNVGYR
jgi:arabinose-5-phosphate isomerase